MVAKQDCPFQSGPALGLRKDAHQQLEDEDEMSRRGRCTVSWHFGTFRLRSRASSRAWGMSVRGTQVEAKLMVTRETVERQCAYASVTVTRIDVLLGT